jgi:8-demethyl-8-(2-methoxy-alpha-L-rhamnosyl)tetracenomycin-C 3'-O-methyltransferase
MPDLDELMLKYGSDKGSTHHNYCPIYEGVFQPQRHDKVELLELGVHQGFSLKAWRDYFDHPESVIAGIDNCLGTAKEVYGTIGPYRPFHQRYGKPVPGICCYLSDQAQIPSGLKGWHPDIIIDDASHLSSKTIASFRTWFPVLKPGGFYVVEDVTSSYDLYFSGEGEANPDPDRPPQSGSQTAMQFFRRLADEVQAYAWTRSIPEEHILGFEIAWICFHPELVVMRKRFSTAQPSTTWRDELVFTLEWEPGELSHRIIGRDVPRPVPTD